MNQEKTYSIAGLRVKITGKQTARAIGGLIGFSVFEINDSGDSDLSIVVDQKISKGELSGVNQIYNHCVMEIDHNLSSYRNGYYFEMLRSDASLVVNLIYDTRTNEVVMSSCDCELSLRFAVWVAYSLLAVSRNIVPVHASTIVKDGYGVLFLGESGTGKSTHTRLWLRHIESSYLLNDDSPLVRIDGERVLVYGSPWSGKTHCYRQEALPVKAMVRLRQGPENLIKKLSLVESIGAVYPSCPPLFAYDEWLCGKMVGIIGKIVTLTPVFELECLPDIEAAEVAYNAIY